MDTNQRIQEAKLSMDGVNPYIRQRDPRDKMVGVSMQAIVRSLYPRIPRTSLNSIEDKDDEYHWLVLTLSRDHNELECKLFSEGKDDDLYNLVENLKTQNLNDQSIQQSSRNNEYITQWFTKLVTCAEESLNSHNLSEERNQPYRFFGVVDYLRLFKQDPNSLINFFERQGYKVEKINNELMAKWSESMPSLLIRFRENY